MIFALLLYLHILSVIVSLGPFFVMFPVLGRMSSAGHDQMPSLIGLFRFTVRLTKHAGHVLVLSGVGLVIVRDWPWTTSWIIATIVIMFSALFFIVRAFTPALRLLADPAQDRTAPLAKLRRAVWIYIAVILLMMWFMVAKPALW